MGSNYISRSFKNIEATKDRDKLCVRYSNMLNKVANMIDDSPVYTSFIKFDIGKNKNKKVVRFDSSSNDPRSNLLVSLDFNKQSVGVANEMEIKVVYDPFRYGQDTAGTSKDSEIVEELDEAIAEAMQWTTDDVVDGGNVEDLMKCWLQYGYNTTYDATVVSPKYLLILTEIDSDMDASTGIITYSLKGTSLLTAFSQNTVSFDEIKDEGVITTVANTLYKYYGNPNQKDLSSKITETRDESQNKGIKYDIVIDDELFDKQQIIESYPAAKDQTPFNYCNTLLYKYGLSQNDKDSREYDNVIDKNQPKYAMSIMDNNKGDGSGTITITYVNPETDENPKIQYPITWSNNSYTKVKSLSDSKSNWTTSARPNNIVLNWKPEVDLRLYILQRMQKQEMSKYTEYIDGSKNVDDIDDQTQREYVRGIVNKASYIDNTFEMYDATLELMGIPADPPLFAELKILPKFLEKESRTARYICYSIM